MRPCPMSLDGAPAGGAVGNLVHGNLVHVGLAAGAGAVPHCAHMTEWTELTGFPRTCASQCAPWGSAARVVNGQVESKLGRPVVLSGARAFLQRLEDAFIAEHRKTSDVQALVDAVFAAHERHLDVIEWCRVRGDELDMSLRVYATRGSTRLHLSLAGPLGRYADQPLPERAAPPVVRARAKKMAAPPAPAPASERVMPPTRPIVLRPIVPGATPNYGDVIAFDDTGRLHVTLRLPHAGDYHFACVEPSGAVTLTPLSSREALRAEDAGAMTGGLMPEVHASGRGLVRIEHYDHSSGMKERVGLAGVWHASRRGLYSHCWALGVRGEWFLRCIVHDKKSTLLGVNLATGKRARVALPDGLVARGAALDGELLRVLGDGEERRYPIDTGSKLALDLAAGTVVACPSPGHVQPVPGSGGAFVVAAGTELRWVAADGTSTGLFVLPADFTAPDYAPWGAPTVAEIAGEAGARSWLVALDFGSDAGPRCRGALVFTPGGTVVNRAHIDAGGVLRMDGVVLPLADGEHVCGYASGPPVAGHASGELAALVRMNDAMALIWAPSAGPRP